MISIKYLNKIFTKIINHKSYLLFLADGMKKGKHNMAVIFSLIFNK
jgi:hypothetical protein